MKAFHWPAISSRVTVDGVVAVVDGAAVAAGRFADDLEALARQRAADESLDHDNPLEEVFEDQIACADLVVLNKRDLVSEADAAAARARIADALPRAVKIVSVADGRVDPAVLLGLGMARLRTISRTAGPTTISSLSTTTTISRASSSRCRRSPSPAHSQRIAGVAERTTSCA